MGTSETFENQQGNRLSDREVSCTQEQWEYLCGELRELSMALRSEYEDIQQLDYRRIESLQGSIYQAFQSTEEALEELQKTYHLDWDSHTTEFAESMESSWNS